MSKTIELGQHSFNFRSLTSRKINSGSFKNQPQIRAKGRIAILYTHYPRNKSMSNWHQLTNLFRKYSVPVVLMGHGHRNRKMDLDSVLGVMTRTNPSSYNQRVDRPVGYTPVKVTPDIYFTERNPEINKSTLWSQLSVRPIKYSSVKINLSDPSINTKLPGVQGCMEGQFTYRYLVSRWLFR